MQLMLDTKQQEILAWVLTDTLSSLGTEIRHTDNHDMQEDLKARRSMLQDILTRLA